MTPRSRCLSARMRSRKRGGALEFEVLCGFAHLRFELDDGRVQLFLGSDFAGDHGHRLNGSRSPASMMAASCISTDFTIDCGVMLFSRL